MLDHLTSALSSSLAIDMSTYAGLPFVDSESSYPTKESLASSSTSASSRQQCVRCNPGNEQSHKSREEVTKDWTQSESDYQSRYDIISLEELAGKALFTHPGHGPAIENSWESRQDDRLGLVSGEFPAYYEELQALRESQLSKKRPFTVADSSWLRHHQGDHNLGEKLRPTDYKLGIHNIESTRDIELNRFGKAGSIEVSAKMRSMVEKGYRMPNEQLIYTGPMNRVFETTNNTYGPFNSEWIGKCSRDFSEQRHSNYNDCASSITQIREKWGDHFKPANGMTDHDDEWMDLWCMLDLASSEAEEHLRASEIKSMLKTFASLQDLTDEQWKNIRITNKENWRELRTFVENRLRRAMDDVLDDYHHLVEKGDLSAEEVPRFLFPTHSMISSVYQQDILQDCPDADRDTTKLKNGEWRSIPFAFRLKEGAERHHSKWGDTEADSQSGTLSNGMTVLPVLPETAVNGVHSRRDFTSAV